MSRDSGALKRELERRKQEREEQRVAAMSPAERREHEKKMESYGGAGALGRTKVDYTRHEREKKEEEEAFTSWGKKSMGRGGVSRNMMRVDAIYYA